jgi:hypothetical protein
LANLIEQRVEMARNGHNPFAICKMKSGWLVIGDLTQNGPFVERMRGHPAGALA